MMTTPSDPEVAEAVIGRRSRVLRDHSLGLWHRLVELLATVVLLQRDPPAEAPARMPLVEDTGDSV